MLDLKNGMKRYMDFYNKERYHQSLDYETPDEVYYSGFRVVADSGLPLSA
jgi:putative transposase